MCESECERVCVSDCERTRERERVRETERVKMSAEGGSRWELVFKWHALKTCQREIVR